MGVYYHYVNYSKRERLSVCALGGSGKPNALGRTLASRAFELMLWQGGWGRDSISIVGDEELPQEFVNIAANAIVLLFANDGFGEIGNAADNDENVFMEICYLVSTRQALELEPHVRQKFGGRYLQRYKELCQKSPWFRPTDLVNAAH